MSPYKKLLNNSLIFTIGNVGSKLITFLMLPVYTYTLSRREYGVTDLAVTTVSFLLPIIFLSISDALLRFTLDKDENKKVIFTNTLLVTIIMGIGTLLVSIILHFLGVQFSFYVGLILVVQSFQQVFAQMSKAIGKERIFAVNGILLAFFTAGLNILLLVGFRLGINGFFISLLLANLFSNLYLFKRINIMQYFSMASFDKNKLIEMLRYSIPLIPNAIAWWGSNDINRYLILFFLGSSFNGIFAVSSKLPSIINLFNSIFFQSWQLSAIEEFDHKDSEEFFSTIFEFYSQLLFLGTTVLICFSKVFMSLIVSHTFYQAWKFSPFLLIATLYQCLSGFIGQIFVASKNTNKIFSTTVYGFVINIFLTAVFLPIIGLQGAGVGAMLSFFTVWIIRQVSVQKIIKLSINWNNIIINNTLMLAETLFLFLGLNLWEFIIMSLVIIVLSFLCNKSIFLSAIRLYRKKIK